MSPEQQTDFARQAYKFVGAKQTGMMERRAAVLCDWFGPFGGHKHTRCVKVIRKHLMVHYNNNRFSGVEPR